MLNVVLLILVILVGLGIIVLAAILYGASRWKARTKAMHSGLEAARLPVAPRTFDLQELVGLPKPVERYLRTALTEGQSMVAAVNVEHAGTFNMSEAGERWRPFTSCQRVITKRPGFVWDARMAMGPGIPVRVHDAYVAGEGILNATLLGLVSLVDKRGTPEVAQGELMRFLAEAAWYPTTLLPSQGMHWEEVDNASAKGTLEDGPATVTMLFRFDEAGLIHSARAEARPRTVNGAVVLTPWEGRWRNYQLRDGMRVPLEGEVAWLLPEGPRPYWRGCITKVSYEFAG